MAALIQDPEELVRENAAASLKRMGACGAYAVAVYLKDDEVRVRATAANVLGSLGEYGAAQALKISPLLGHSGPQGPTVRTRTSDLCFRFIQFSTVLKWFLIDEFFI